MFLYFSVFLLIIFINSNMIVTSLNNSLFIDSSEDSFVLDNVNESFFNGTSFVFIFFLLGFSIFGSFIISIVIINILFSGLSLANQLKVEQRNEFITFNEIKTITSPKELLSLIDINASTVWLVICVTLLSIIIMYMIIVFLSKRFHFYIGYKLRISVFCITIMLLMVVLQKPNLYNESILKYQEVAANNWNPVARAQKDGFIPSFIHTIKPSYMKEPENYSKDNMNRIHQKYSSSAKEINQKRSTSINDTLTIIYLSETFMDPMSIPNLIKNENPIPFITTALEDRVSGTMYSPYIGGGTANIEWSILTSFSLELLNNPLTVTPYSDFYLSAKNHNTILNYFHNRKIALHPYTANFYKRRSVYNAIGMDEFLYLDNGIEHTEKLGTHIRISDAAFHQDIMREAKNENTGFIHALTMQNHSPYTGEISDMNYIPEINSDIYPSEKEHELINYIQGLHASDQAISELIESLEALDKDVNILFFGDHLPNLFRGLENNFPNGELYQTPWFIYMNNDRSTNKKNFEQLSPIFLSAILLQEGDYFVSPFHGLLEELLDKGVRRIGTDYIVTPQGKIEDYDIDIELLKLIDDYRNIVFDELFGSSWLPNDFFIPNQ